MLSVQNLPHLFSKAFNLLAFSAVSGKILNMKLRFPVFYAGIEG
jgi:hypothetical protein